MTFLQHSLLCLQYTTEMHLNIDFAFQYRLAIMVRDHTHNEIWNETPYYITQTSITHFKPANKHFVIEGDLRPLIQTSFTVTLLQDTQCNSFFISMFCCSSCFCWFLCYIFYMVMWLALKHEPEFTQSNPGPSLITFKSGHQSKPQYI